MEDIKLIIKQAFVEKKRDIYDAIERDYKENGLQIQYSKLEEVLDKPYTSSNEENKTIVAIYNGNIYIMLEIILKSLLHNKNIILVCEGENSFTKDIILSIIREVLTKKGISIMVKEYVDADIDNILQQDMLIDKIIYFGDKRNYRQLKYNTNIPTIYYGYGSIIVYVDDEDEFEEELIQLGEYEYINNFYIYKFLGNIDEDIEFINRDGENFCSIILSKNEEKIQKFKQKVHSTNILVNEVNFDLKCVIPDEWFMF